MTGNLYKTGVAFSSAHLIIWVYCVAVV